MKSESVYTLKCICSNIIMIFGPSEKMRENCCRGIWEVSIPYLYHCIHKFMWNTYNNMYI